MKRQEESTLFQPHHNITYTSNSNTTLFSSLSFLYTLSTHFFLLLRNKKPHFLDPQKMGTRLCCCFIVLISLTALATTMADQSLQNSSKDDIKCTPCGQVPSPPPPSPPPPAPPTTTSCPPPPSPPSSGGGGTYYSSPPPPAQYTYSSPPPPTSSGGGNGGGTGGGYYPPPNKYYPTPPPPNPIVPYFPFYYYSPPPPPSTAAPPPVKGSLVCVISLLPLFMALL